MKKSTRPFSPFLSIIVPVLLALAVLCWLGYSLSRFENISANRSGEGKSPDAEETRGASEASRTKVASPPAADAAARRRVNFISGKPPRAEDMDVRSLPQSATPDDKKRAAVAKLEAEIPGVKVDFDPLSGAPALVQATGRFLTVAGAEKKSPREVAEDFVRRHSDLFGHAAGSVREARVTREDVTAHSGMTTLVWNQQLDDIPLYKTIFKANVTKNGELITVSSHFLPDPAAAAGKQADERQAQIAKPAVDVANAITLAAASVSDEVPAAAVQAQSDPEGAERKQRFTAQKLSDTTAQLTWMPMSADSLKLAWDVTTFSLAQNEMFRIVVDAESGEVLSRTSLTADISPATYRVYADSASLQPFDSPMPFSPGHSTPSSVQPPEVPRQLITTQAENTTASPDGWVPDGGTTTLGNNVQAHTDTNADNIADLPRPTSATRNFDFPVNFTQSPTLYKDALVTQLFYMNNWIHDKMYALGFTEASGNFQTNNFGRGGLGNDAVQADAQDGSGTNNANFSTPPDGSPGRMQMFLWTAPEPDRDSDFDNEIIIHEYGHGVSNRLVGGGVGLSALQSRGMGEGWSDFYAMALLSQPTDDINGQHAKGGYSTYLLSGMTSNYYFGIRRYPYGPDMNKSPLTYRDIDPTQARPHTGIPLSPRYGGVSNGNPSQFHAQGEVWCNMLWEVRRNLVIKHGHAAGNHLALLLVTDGMKLTPANPNFIQSRDGIIQADVVSNSGANLDEIWAGFAKRGLGFSATGTANSTTTGVAEAYDVPDDLSVTPSTTLAASGPVGGPFSPALRTYTLTNTGTAPLTWTAVVSQPWMSLSNAAGTLAGGGSTTVTMAFNNAANALAAGSYGGTVSFTNSVTNVSLSRSVTLTTGTGVDYFTELFDTTPNDTDNQSWLFTPDASPGQYFVTRSSSATFPTDPAGGTPLSLALDDFEQVSLTGGAQVLLYGTSYPGFFVSSKAYVTFLSGDLSWTESFSQHFSQPRIAALFDDLDPSVAGAVSWKQMSDRAAVTWQNVPEYGTSNQNSVQIEMFFDGRIRITCLSVAATDGLIGLSRGVGVPAGFLESDFSAYGAGGSGLTLQLSAPASATEGDGVLVSQGNVTLPAASGADVVVTLTSHTPGEATVPGSVTVPAGLTSTAFDITVVDDALVDGVQNAIFSASAVGYSQAARVMQVNDNESAGALTLSAPSTVTEGVGVVTGTITTSVVAGAPLTASLTSSDTTEATVPASIVIPAGVNSVNFPITIVNDVAIDGPQTANLTATLPGWTTGATTVTVNDNESAVLTVSLPATVSEGGTATGTVGISGTLTTPLTVTLTSDNTSRLTVPNTITITAGANSASFTVTGVNNTLTDGSAVVGVGATTSGFTSGSANITVLDNDLHHYAVSPIGVSQVTGAPFSVTLTAKDVNDVTITSYTGSASLAAAGAGGAVTITPATSGAFSSGVRTLNITASTSDTGVVLTASDGAGHTGTSNVFDVGAGDLHHFAWSTIPSPQTAGTPFSTTITAQDIANNTVASFNGTANLSALLNGATLNLGTGGTIYAIPFNTSFAVTRSQQIHLAGELGGAGQYNSLAINITTLPAAYTLNNWTIRLKHTALSTWNAGGFIWETADWTTVHQGTATPTATGWITFMFSTPFTYNGTDNLMIDYSYNNASAPGSQIQCAATTRSGSRSMNYYTSSAGNPLLWSGTTPSAFPDSRVTDIRLGLAATPPGMIPMTSGTFTAGAWTGNVTVNQAAMQMRLRASSGAITGDSNTFDVTSTVTANAQSVSVPHNTPTVISLTGQDTANPGATLSYGVVTNPTSGILSGTAPNLTYMPNSGFSGADSFTFTAANGAAVSAPATVSITVQQAPPEIVVEQPAGTGLTDGTSTVAYGTIPQGVGSVRTFTIRNTGALNLVVSSITKDGTNSPDITIGAISSSTIAAGGSATFDVTFTPSAPGARSAAIHILSNDSDEASFDINLSASATASPPDIAIEQPSGTLRPDSGAIIDFGTTLRGVPVTRTFTLRNTGASDLTLSGASLTGANSSLFALGALSATTIAPSATATLNVTFTPQASGAALAQMIVTSNDPDESPYEIELHGVGTILPGPVTLVRDINTVGLGNSIPGFVISGANAYFNYGTSIYRTNATDAGTASIGTLASTANTAMALAGTTLVWAGFDVNGTELWSYNGTTSSRLADIFAGTSSSSPALFTTVGSVVYFAATNGTAGIELWKTDGTAIGTVLVKDIAPGSGSSSIANLTNVGGTLFFTANDGTNGVELWKSDGTTAGTVMVSNLNAGSASSNPAALTAVGSTVFFSATNGTSGVELFKSDGTTTSLVLDIVSGTGSSSPAALFNHGGTLFFRATTAAAGVELWKSDGTSGGTLLVKDIFAGASSSTPSNFTTAGSILFFTAIDSNSNGVELWKTDGTNAGTVMVSNINTAANAGSSPSVLTAVGTSLFFSATDATTGAELWKSDGTAVGTIRVKDINLGAGSAGITTAANLGGVLIFGATDGVTGLELWRSDGAFAGTYRVRDISVGNGGALGAVLAFGTEVILSANDGITGTELWKSDGTLAGTVQVKDIFSGASSSNPGNLTLLGSTLYFSATDSANGTELWKSDGTNAGTNLVLNINANSTSSSLAQLRAAPSAGIIYFSAAGNTADGSELWRSDGTAAGTTLIKNINPTANGSSNIANPVVVNGTHLYFSATDGTNGSELWVSDGSNAGTVMLKDINPGPVSSSPGSITVSGGTLYFAATEASTGTELWKSDGTAAGTVQVKDINPGAGSGSPGNLAIYNGLLYFSANDGVNGAEIWVSDGTAAGTTMLADINPGSLSSTPASFTVHGGALYFSATNTFGSELWKTNGTTAGTMQVKDINPGSGGSSPGNLTPTASHLYFSASTSANGGELWRTDGTAAGTQMVADLLEGSSSSSPAQLRVVGSRLFFTASVTGIGTELFSYDLGSQPELALFEGVGTTGTERQDNVGSHDFGLQNSATTRSFTISNTGNGLLYISDVSVTGAQPDSFVVLGKPDPSVPLLPGGTHTFSVTATLEGPLNQSAVVGVLSNDADESSFEIPVTVTVDDAVPPQISAPVTYLIGQPGQLAMSLPDLRGIVAYSDNRAGDGTISQVPLPGDIVLAIGQTAVVTFTALDSAGNVSNTVNTTVQMGLGQPNTGHLAWAHSGGGVGSEGTASRVAATSDGGAVVAGAFNSSPFTLGSGVNQVVLTPVGTQDVFVAKFARDGTLQWARSGGGTGTDSVAGLVELADGSIVLAGTFSGSATFSGTTVSGSLSTDSFLVRYLADGSLAWAKGWGGTGADAVTQLVKLADGNLAITGTFTTTATITLTSGVTLSNNGASLADLFLIKYQTSDGSALWARSFGSNLSGESSAGLNLAATQDGGMALCGGLFSPTLLISGSAATIVNTGVGGTTDWFALKYDSSGSLQWARNICGGAGADVPSAIQVFSNGDLAVAGSFSSSGATFGTGSSLPQTFSSLGGNDVAVIRISGSDGLQSWARRAGGNSSDSVSAMLVLPDNSVALAGLYANGTMQIGINEVNQTTLTAATTVNKTFVARLNGGDGTLRWAKTASGTAVNIVTGMVQLGGGDLGVAGTFGTPSEVFGAGEASQTTLLNAGTGNDVFVAKFSLSNGNLVWARRGGGINGESVQALAALENGSAMLVGTFQPPSATFGLGESSEVTLVNADTAGTNTDFYFARFHGGGVEPPVAPLVALRNPSGLSSTTLTFNAGIDSRAQETTVMVEYGATLAYGSTVTLANVPPGFSAETRSLTLSGLAPQSTLNFRVTATNAAGATTSGNQVITTYPDAEIAVEQPSGNGISDGGPPVAFGAVAIGASQSRTFTIRNDGTTGTLVGLAVSKDGPAAADYSLGALGATSLAPGLSTTFTVTYTPSAGGVRAAAIHIASNDGDENPFDIALTGNNLLPVVFNAGTDVPINASGYTVPAGRSLGITLGFAPSPGTLLKVVDNTSSSLINGAFVDLPQGGYVQAVFGGQTYTFLASYVGGDGNDFVLTATLDWTWVKGSNTTTANAIYGTVLVPAVGNTPGGRSNTMTWSGNDGSLWLFGGVSSTPATLNDLWRYTPSSGLWTWMKGSSSSGQAGTYGTFGVASASSTPGARHSGMTWVDGDGRLWLFGGNNSATLSGLYHNDLWVYDPLTNNWAWMGGTNALSANGTYGTQGTGSTSNIPGARQNANAWSTASGVLYLWGGQGYPATGSAFGNLNDLWKFDPTTGQWTWLKGANTLSAASSYGTKGVASATNTPGPRSTAANWTDAQGALWLFGGSGVGSSYSGPLGDLWKYDPATNNWTWMSGTGSIGFLNGNFGTKGQPAAANTPSYRQYASAWTGIDGRLWLFGGIGYAVSGASLAELNDLWCFDIASNQWTWMKGANTSQANGVYGVLNTPAVGNHPGARQITSTGASFAGTTPLRDLWLFGGSGFASTGSTSARLNDLWTLDLPNLPSALTLAFANKTDTSVTLNAGVNPNGVPGSLRFRYSTAANLAGATLSGIQSTGAGVTGINMSQTLSGFAPGTTYYYQAEVFSSGGQALGAILSFTTLTTIEAWRLANFGSTAGTGNQANTGDFDSDGILNLFEFAFGTNPNSNASGPGVLVTTGGLAGGALVSTGQPITMFGPIPTGTDFRAVFIRRKDYVTAGLTYTPQFSANLSTWVNSAVVPTVLADDGTYQAVSVPYPFFIAGKKARFFRIQVSILP
jgi:trimeric autotransporter adhesin